MKRGLLWAGLLLTACAKRPLPPGLPDGGLLAACGALPDGGLPLAVAAPVSGTFAGADVDATFCTDGAAAQLERTPDSLSVPSQLVLFLLSAWWESPNCTIETPAGAFGCELDFAARLGSATPGTSRSSDAGACYHVDVSIDYPTPDVDCGHTVYPAPCPTGCAYEGGPVGSEPICQPAAPPSKFYAAEMGGPETLDCILNGSTGGGAHGSWTLQLTSATLAQGDGGPQSYYAVHGQLNASLREVDDSGNPTSTTATLKAQF